MKKPLKFLSILILTLTFSQCAILPPLKSQPSSLSPPQLSPSTPISTLKKSTTQPVIVCPLNQILIQGKDCVQACSQQILKQCENSLDDIFDGWVCAYDYQNKIWNNYGSRCMGCQDENVIGFTYGKCQSSESVIDVGIALSDENWKDILPGVPICGQYQFYTKQKGCIKACTHPQFKKCAKTSVTSALSADYKFCAYKSDGKWNNFVDSCQACASDCDYLGVINGKCDTTVISNPPPTTTSSLKCKSDTDCKPSDKCMLGYCLNRCSGILCKTGTQCINGNCIPIPLSSQCRTDKNCAINQFCSNGKCISKQSKCGNTICKLSQKCVYNKCINNNNTIVVDKCSTVKCWPGFICVDGNCLPQPRKCKSGGQCGVGEKCDNLLGVCVDKCSGVKCLASQTCVQGACKQNKCGKILCPKGTYCKSGVCVPDIAVCLADASYKTTVCTDPRPTEKTCPTVQYFRAPDPLFCGVKADGTRVNFPRECDTCKDSSIVYYFDKPCHKVPFVCKKDDICTDTGYCSSTCRVNQECPYDWQICNSGRCVDQCTTMKCAAGPCKFGQCQFVEASGACTLGASSGCKKDQWSCVGFECADLCLRQACPAYQKCNPKSGACEVITTGA